MIQKYPRAGHGTRTKDSVQEALDQAKPLLWQSALIFSPAMNVLVLTSSLYMMQVFDRVLTSQSSATLIYLTLIAMGAICVLSMLDLVRSRIISRVGLWFEQKLSVEGLQRALESTLAGKEYRTEALRDLATLRSFFGGQGITNLFDLPWIPIYIGVIFLLNPYLGLVTLVGALLLAFFAWLNDRQTQGITNIASKEQSRSLHHVETAMRNAEVIDVMGMMPGMVQKWYSNMGRANALQLRAGDLSGNIMSLSKFVRLALQIFILAVGAHLVLNRELTSGGMIAASIIMSRALAPIEVAIGSWRYTLAAQQAYERLREMFSRPLLRPTGMVLPPPEGHLTVEGVVYVPPNEKIPVIKGVSFDVIPGRITALVGPAAAGKSTLARLCVGAYAPTQGHVRLDSADVFLWDRKDFSQYVGYLPQDVELFSGTVRDNIARLSNCDPVEVVEAAQLAGVHEMILRLPQGYETEIGEGGILLSGGQRQRVALARAVFRAPQLVVLDEPNSSLDSEGEEALNQTIKRLKDRGVTVLMIGHRPSIMAHVDHIIVLRDGRIEAMGPKQEILSRILPRSQQHEITKSQSTNGYPAASSSSDNLTRRPTSHSSRTVSGHHENESATSSQSPTYAGDET